MITQHQFIFIHAIRITPRLPYLIALDPIEFIAKFYFKSREFPHSQGIIELFFICNHLLQENQTTSSNLQNHNPCTFSNNQVNVYENLSS